MALFRSGMISSGDVKESFYETYEYRLNFETMGNNAQTNATSMGSFWTTIYPPPGYKISFIYVTKYPDSSLVTLQNQDDHSTILSLPSGTEKDSIECDIGDKGVFVQVGTERMMINGVVNNMSSNDISIELKFEPTS